jgi:hypothetical protein
VLYWRQNKHDDLFTWPSIIRWLYDEEVMMKEILDFLADLQHPEMYGWAVTDEVRKKAKQLLEQYKKEEEQWHGG